MSVSILDYSVETPRHQLFSLPFPIILYLLETEVSHLLLKLQQTCKYIFARKRIVIAVGEKLYRPTRNIVHFESDHRKQKVPFGRGWYWLTQLEWYGNDCCTTLRPHIYRLNLSSLSIFWSSLSLKDIDFLLSNEKMETLYLWHVNIQDEDGNLVPIDYILRKVPHISTLCFWNPCEIYSNQSWKKLNEIKLFNKFKLLTLDINHTSEQIDPEGIGKFIENNVASAGEIVLYFPPDAPEIAPITNKLQQIVNNWVAPGEPPTFLVEC